MDYEGYPEMDELKRIETWDYKDFLGLIDFIEERWMYADCGYFKKKWGKDEHFHNPVLIVHMSTAGWSGNEEIMGSLLVNKLFCMIWYYSWQRGGHYVFKINPYNVGYETIAAVAKKKNISRQYIHKTKDKYDWIIVDGGKNLIKPKTE